MSREYHYLVAGLPDIFYDDQKINISLADFRELLKEGLHLDDFDLIRQRFWKYDNDNILDYLKDNNAELNVLANLSKTDIEDIILHIKEESTHLISKDIPQYIVNFIIAYKKEEPLIKEKSWDLQLTEFFYNHIDSLGNNFVKAYFTFNKTLINIITASNCKKYDIKVANELIGNDEITEKLIKSNARDFGFLKDEIIYLDQILKITEETDLLERERKLDKIKWTYLDNESFFHYFDIEKIFTYLIKVEIIERWMKLDKDTGKKLFHELLSNLEASFEFPEEFKV